MRKLIPIYAVMLLAPAILQAAVIIDDSFADGDRAATGLNGELDANWWSSSQTSGSNVEDGTAGQLGLVTGTSGRGMHATFAPQTLAVGQTMNVSYSFTTPATVGTAKGGAFKVALMDFNNAGLAADQSSSSSSVNALYVGQPGYMADMDVNSLLAADVSVRLHDVTATSGRFLGTSGEWIDSGSSADNGYAILADTAYMGVFSVARTATGVDVSNSLSLGATELDSYTRSYSSVASNLGMFGIWANSNTFGTSNSAGDADNGIKVTNLTVEVIPEPATLGLLALSGAVLFATRRMRLR